MTTLVDKWGIHPQHYWLRGHQPEQPVQVDKDGVLNVYGYSEALEILSDPETFSSDTARLFLGDVEVDESFGEGTLLQAQPPRHGKLRKLVSRAFTPKMVDDLEPRISELTHELLDEVAEKDHLELVADLAYPLPVIVIAELLGVPGSDRDLIKQWVDKMAESASALMSTDHGEEQEEEQEYDAQAALRHVPEMLDYLRGHVVERRRQPRQDLLTELVQAEVDGERLTDNQVVNFANELMVVGHATTSALLGNTVLCLDAYPDQAERVREDRSMVPGVIEETLRFLSPIVASYRVPTTEVNVAGQRVSPEQMVAVWLGAANRDTRQFAHPDVFDSDRHPNPHIGFGRGIHFCLGAPLARLEGRIALNILLDRFPVLRTDPDNPPVFWPMSHVIGVSALPLRIG